MKNKTKVALRWQEIPTSNPNLDWDVSRAYNDHNGMVVGDITHHADRAIYTSFMPKSSGDQWVFINVAKAKEWVEARYAEGGEGDKAKDADDDRGRPAAPELPKATVQ